MAINPGHLLSRNNCVHSLFFLELLIQVICFLVINVCTVSFSLNFALVIVDIL